MLVYIMTAMSVCKIRLFGPSVFEEGLEVNAAKTKDEAVFNVSLFWVTLMYSRL